MIAAEQFRRRLMANRADIDCGYVTIEWGGSETSSPLRMLGADFNMSQVSGMEVNGVSVAVSRYIILPADATVTIRFRNLYDCRAMLAYIGHPEVGMVGRSPSVVNVANLDTSLARTMNSMFLGCYVMDSITGLAAFNTSKVTDMSSMFHDAKRYNAVEISNWDVSKVVDFRRMFYDNLSSSDGTPTTFELSAWDTSSAVYMGRMFRRQRQAISINVSGWNTSKVVGMGNMFSGCDALTSLDLSSFDFSAILSGGVAEEESDVLTTEEKSMYGMFAGNQSLTEVTMSKAISSDAKTPHLFHGIATDGVFRYNPAHLADYQAKIFPRLPSGWTTQAL